MNITALGIDIAKNVFQLHGVDEQGKTVLQKKISRDKLVSFIAKLPPCKIGMESCGGSNAYFTPNRSPISVKPISDFTQSDH